MKPYRSAVAGLTLGSALGLALGAISQHNSQPAPIQASPYQIATANSQQLGPDLPPGSIPAWRVDKIARISAYNALEAQTDNDPLVASCGPLADAPGQVIAVSRDLFFASDGRKRCGQEVAVVYADGRVTLAYIWDTMAARYQGTVDVLLDTHQEAVQHGVQQGELHWLD